MHIWCLFIFGLVGLSSAVTEEINKYENYTLVRVLPQTTEELQAISTFKDPMGEVEILKACREMNDTMDLLVPETRMDFVKKFMTDTKAMFEVKQENYGRKFESMDRTPRRRVMGSSFNPFAYNSYRHSMEFIIAIADRHPNLVTLEHVGNSYEGRRMTLVKISSNPSAGNPIIFIDAGIHAREWVAPAMVLYSIHRLANDPSAKQNELRGVDWYFLPFVNPDGYEFSRSSPNNRLWRKTRSKHGRCYGVDGNRNYGFKWAVSGVSTNPCDKETYAGPEPFSEPETRIVKKIMMDYAKRIKLYVSLHSYGQYLVYPWGYTEHSLPPTWRKLDSLARHVSDAVQHAGGQPFKVLSAGKWYPAAGGSDDFAFGAVGVPYSYTMELTNGHEFIFPEHLLKTVLPQFYAGFKEFGEHVRREFGHVRRHNSRESRADDSDKFIEITDTPITIK